MEKLSSILATVAVVVVVASGLAVFLSESSSADPVAAAEPVDVKFTDDTYGLVIAHVDSSGYAVVDKAKALPGSTVSVMKYSGITALKFTVSSSEYYMVAFNVIGLDADFYNGKSVVKDGDAFVSTTPYSVKVGDYPEGTITDAKSVAKYIATSYEDETGVSVSWAVEDGATADKAILVQTYKDASGNVCTATLTVTKETDVKAAFTKAVASVNGYIGTTESGSTYTSLVTKVDGAAYTSALLQLSDRMMVRFAMTAGDMLIVTDTPVCVGDATASVLDFFGVVSEGLNYRPVAIVTMTAGDNGRVAFSKEVISFVPYGTSLSVDGNIIYIGDHPYPAMPIAATEQATYSFWGWVFEGDVPSTIMGDLNVLSMFTTTLTPTADTSGNLNIDVSEQGVTVVQVAVPSNAKHLTLSDSSENASVYVADTSSINGKTITVFDISSVIAPAGKEGDAYELTFQVDGVTYSGDMKVTLPYEAQVGKTPVVYYYNNGSYQKMSNVSLTGSEVTFQTDHNSTYVVVMEYNSMNKDVMFVVTLVIAVIVSVIAIYGVVRRSDDQY